MGHVLVFSDCHCDLLYPGVFRGPGSLRSQHFTDMAWFTGSLVPPANPLVARARMLELLPVHSMLGRSGRKVAVNEHPTTILKKNRFINHGLNLFLVEAYIILTKASLSS